MSLSDTLRLASETDNDAHAALLASILNTDAVARRALGLPTQFTARDVQRVIAHYRDYVPNDSGIPIPVRMPRAVSSDSGSASALGEAAVADALRA